MSNFKRKESLTSEEIIDLSRYNIIDGIKKAIFYSTSNFLDYDNRVIRIILKDEEAKKIVSKLKLKNTILDVKHKELRKVIGIE